MEASDIRLIDPCGACNSLGRFDATGRPTPYGVVDCGECLGTGSTTFRCAYSTHFGQRQPISELDTSGRFKSMVCKKCIRDMDDWGTG